MGLRISILAAATCSGGRLLDRCGRLRHSKTASIDELATRLVLRSLATASKHSPKAGLSLELVEELCFWPHANS